MAEKYVCLEIYTTHGQADEAGSTITEIWGRFGKTVVDYARLGGFLDI